MEPSTPSWRVFDAPSAPAAPGHGEGGKDTARGLVVQPLVLAAIGAAILVGGIAVAIALGGPGGSAAGPETTGGFAAETGAVDGALGMVVVDVAGAVVTPGVYRLSAGARVSDAIQAAGGLGPRVDAARVAAELNLAATLTDGQQIRIPSRDDTSAGAGSAGGGNGSGGAAGALIDLNSATQAELESLPGIGPVTATKILESRAQSPFHAIDDLRARGLVGQKTFDSLRALVTVG